MKKSQLKNIIKESIKELMEDEQHDSHYRLHTTICDSNYGLPVGNNISIIQNSGTQCNGQMCTQSDIGQTFTWHWSLQPGPSAGGSNYFTFTLDSFDTPMHGNNPKLVISSNCSNPSYLTSWDCKGGIKNPKCVEIQGTGGQFLTKQDCLTSGCEGLGPGGPSTGLTSTPLTTDPQSMTKPEDDEMRRMQDLANIRRDV